MQGKNKDFKAMKRSYWSLMDGNSFGWHHVFQESPMQFGPSRNWRIDINAVGTGSPNDPKKGKYRIYAFGGPHRNNRYIELKVIGSFGNWMDRIIPLFVLNGFSKEGDNGLSWEDVAVLIESFVDFLKDSVDYSMFSMYCFMDIMHDEIVEELKK
jgi:hypothetical protein